MTIIDQILDPLMLKVLTEEANKIAVSARQNANWSSKIPNAIKVGTANIVGQGKYSIEITVDTSENAAPMARAFEYGSGLHATKEPAKLYPIRAKNASNLVFWWERGNKWFVGKQLPYGHPGVAPRPYLIPAIEQNKPSIKARIISFFKRGLLDSIKVEFRDISKK